MKIECNVGGTERAVRIVIGIVLPVFSYFALSGALAIAGYVVGAIMLITGISTYCLLNTIIGRNSCKVKQG